MILFHLVLNSRMTGAMTLLPPHAFIECMSTSLRLSF